MGVVAVVVIGSSSSNLSHCDAKLRRRDNCRHLLVADNSFQRRLVQKKTQNRKVLSKPQGT